jgi:hypothetical protein
MTSPLFTRTTGLLCLSSVLSVGIFVCAHMGTGGASFGLNLITPLFALAHHLFALVVRRAPPRELGVSLRAVAVVYTLATIIILVISTLAAAKVHDLHSAVAGEHQWSHLMHQGWFKCDGPRKVMLVVAQDVLGVAETAVIWLLYKSLTRRFIAAEAAVDGKDNVEYHLLNPSTSSKVSQLGPC